MKQIRLLAIVLFSVVTAHSQTIKGKLLDLVDNKPLAGATLSLVSLKDSLAVHHSVADSSGIFQFQGLPVDSFFLKVSFIGYEEYKQIVVTGDSTPVVDLGTLFIPKSTKELSGVVVVSKTPPAQQKGDTTQFNASQFKVNPDATTEDLIKKMPGITVDKDGTVTAQGDQVKKVTIDGREFFGDDATAALRNLPSEVVDKIQVFDKLSDQAQFTGFDDGNSQKAINIVTKSGLKNGQFGRIYAGYGTDDHYSAGGNVSFFNGDRRISLIGNINNINQQNFGSQDLLGVTSSGGGRGGFSGGGGRGGGGRPSGGGGGRGGFGGGENFTVGQQSGISKTNAAGINFADKWGQKLDVTASYFFNNSNNSNDNTIAQTYLTGDIGKVMQRSLSSSNNYNHRFNLRLEYKIDSNNSLIINPSLNFQNNKSVSESHSLSFYNTGDTSNASDVNNTNNRNGYNLRNNILFRHSFAKRGRTLSVNLTTTFNKNNSTSYDLGDYRFFDKLSGSLSDSARNQFTNNPTNGYVLSTNIAYTEPIGEKSQLQFSYSPSYTKNKADQQTYTFDPFDDKYTQFEPSLSNRFDNTVITQNGGVSYRLGASRDDQFSVGVNFQHSRLESDRIYPTISQVDQSFNTVLPNLMWRKKISPRSSFNIFYRASTNFPSVTQLQDVVNTNNPLQVSSGNPDLKQSYTHFISGRYTFINTLKGQSFFANVFLQASQDYISNAVFTPISDSTIQQGIVLKSGSQLTKPVNLDGYKSLRTFFTYSMPVKFIKSNINLSTGFSYSKLPGLFNNIRTNTDNYTYNAGIVIASNVSEYVDFNLSYNANFNDAKSSVDGASQHYVNQAAGIQMNLLSKNGWFLQNDVSNQSNSGLSSGFNQSFWLWNAAIGKKFLRNRAGELKLSVFDLLKQNQSITRTVNEIYIEDSQSSVLQQYFMLTFTYNLKNFGTPARSSRPGGRPMMNF